MFRLIAVNFTRQRRGRTGYRSRRIIRICIEALLFVKHLTTSDRRTHCIIARIIIVNGLEDRLDEEHSLPYGVFTVDFDTPSFLMAA